MRNGIGNLLINTLKCRQRPKPLSYFMLRKALRTINRNGTCKEQKFLLSNHEE